MNKMCFKKSELRIAFFTHKTETKKVQTLHISVMKNFQISLYQLKHVKCETELVGVLTNRVLHSQIEKFQISLFQPKNVRYGAELSGVFTNLRMSLIANKF